MPLMLFWMGRDMTDPGGNMKSPSLLRTIAAMIRSLLFYILLILSLTIGWVCLLLFSFTPFSWRQRAAYVWGNLYALAMRYICGVKVTIAGGENLSHCPAVLIAKHESAWETMFFQSLILKMVVLYKQELNKIPVYSYTMRLLDYIAIDRKAGKKALRTLIDEGSQRLNNGISVLIFPEGTRAKIGEDPPFFAGGAFLAKKAGYPIIPIAFESGKCWPKGWVIYPGKIQMVIGQPLSTKDKSATEINEITYQWMKTTMKHIRSDAKDV